LFVHLDTNQKISLEVLKFVSWQGQDQNQQTLQNFAQERLNQSLGWSQSKQEQPRGECSTKSPQRLTYFCEWKTENSDNVQIIKFSKDDTQIIATLPLFSQKL